MRTTGAGGRQGSAEWGRFASWCRRRASMSPCASRRAWHISPRGSSSRSFESKLSTVPFSHGLPGSMGAVSAPQGGDPRPQCRGCELGAVVRADVPRHAAREHELGQDLEDLRRAEPALDPDRQRRPRELVDHARAIRSFPPSWVRSPTKSWAQTWSGRSGRSRTHDPSPSRSRPRFGCLLGTLSPSRRQMRSTRFLFTAQPACLRRAAIRRWAWRPEARGPLDDVGRQPGLVVGRPGPSARRRTRLAQDPAGPALRHAERLADPGHRLAARRGADQFRCADLRFPGSPASKDELVQREVGHRPTQARVLLLELLQTPHLLELQAAELASPAVAARRGLEPLAARASPSLTPTLRIASASDAPCATLTSTPPAASRPPLRSTLAIQAAWRRAWAQGSGRLRRRFVRCPRHAGVAKPCSRQISRRTAARASRERWAEPWRTTPPRPVAARGRGGDPPGAPPRRTGRAGTASCARWPCRTTAAGSRRPDARAPPGR